MSDWLGEGKRPLVTHDALVADLRALGVREGEHVLVRAALRELGPASQRARLFTEALLEVVGPRGSVFGLSFTPAFKLPLRGHGRRFVYTPETPAVTGGYANYLLSREDALRSRHPMASFVGVGARAQAFLSEHDGTRPAFEPVRKLADDPRGRMLLVGKAYEIPGISTVHVAQYLLGMRGRSEGRTGVRVQGADGAVALYTKNYSAGCSRGFGKFYAAYRSAGAIREGFVAEASALYADLALTLGVELDILREEPGFFMCDDGACRSCRRDWSFARAPAWRWALDRSAWMARTIPPRLFARLGNESRRRGPVKRASP
jgi:aminoglycoside 3-N-acetyltransferase